MPVTDPRIDAYIEQSADFAKPILAHLRAVVHASCPDVEETIKWGFPHFMYKGMLCSMASFKGHCAFGFWRAKALLDQSDDKTQEAMGQFGRIAAIADLPSPKTLGTYIRKAMKLNDTPDTPKRAKAAARPAPAVPDDLRAALAAAQAAQQHFDAFSPSQQREYVEWIMEAKTDATPAPPRPGHRMAWRRQAAQLEIRELLAVTCGRRGGASSRAAPGRRRAAGRWPVPAHRPPAGPVPHRR